MADLDSPRIELQRVPDCDHGCQSRAYRRSYAVGSFRPPKHDALFVCPDDAAYTMPNAISSLANS